MERRLFPDPRGLALLGSGVLYLLATPGVLAGFIDTYILAPLQRLTAPVYGPVRTAWLNSGLRLSSSIVRMSGYQGPMYKAMKGHKMLSLFVLTPAGNMCVAVSTLCKSSAVLCQAMIQLAYMTSMDHIHS